MDRPPMRQSLRSRTGAESGETRRADHRAKRNPLYVYAGIRGFAAAAAQLRHSMLGRSSKNAGELAAL